MRNHKYVVDKSDIVKLLRGEPLALVNGQFSIEIMQDMTNGDMIKAVFPNEEFIDEDRACVYYGAKMRFIKDWWNADYKAESAESENKE